MTVPTLFPSAPTLVCVGTSHRHASVELRERLAFGPEAGAQLGRHLARGSTEAIALSTCNRSELYLAHDDPDEAARLACAELERLSGLPGAELSPALYRLRGRDAVLHLLRVASGLDSLVPGETQILGQLRTVSEAAEAAGTSGPILRRLFREALRAGRRVRSETGIALHHPSVPAAAAELASSVLGGLAGRRLLLIGAGKMSELSAAHLVAGGVKSVFVTNRSRERALALAHRFGGEAVELERLEEELTRADLVVASTRSPLLVVSAEQVARVLPRRNGRPLLLIDIAVPRDLDPAIAALDGCRLVDIDDLAVGVSGLDRRRLRHAEAMLAAEADAFLAWQRSLDVVPVVSALRRRAEEVRAAELGRADHRLGALSERERRAVDAATARIVAKLLHEPTVRLKQAAGGGDGAAYADALRYLFDLEEER